MDYNSQNQSPAPAASGRIPKISFAKLSHFLDSKSINKKFALYLFLGILALIFIPDIVKSIFSPTTRTVSVVGVGSKAITPEKANVSFSLVVSSNTKTEAIASGEEKFNKIISGLSAFSPESVKKSNYQITQSGVASSGTLSSSFQYVNAAEISVTNPDSIQKVVTYLHESGATQVGQVRFTPKDQEKTNTQVRELAIKDAREKAVKMASAAGAGLGRVLSITEGASNSSTGTPVTGTTTDNTVGDITVQSAVTVIYELR